MSITLEQVFADSTTNRNFEKLAALVIDTGNQRVGIRFGSGTVTFDGTGQTSPATTVTHGLGKTPAAVLVGASGTANVLYGAFSPGATSFTVQGATRDESTPANGTARNFYWIAVG